MPHDRSYDASRRHAPPIARESGTSPSPPGRKRSLIERRAQTLAVLILAAQGVLLGWGARLTSPVLDELPHLAAGLGHWELGTFDLYRVNPPLVRLLAAVPVMVAGSNREWLHEWPDDPFGRPEFALGRRFVAVNGARSLWLFTLARWACVPLIVAGGYVCFLWGRDLYGAAAGLTAVALWAFCPHVLGWGATICPDAPAAATGLSAGYAFWRWLRTPSWSAVALAGLALGLALLTKSTWIVLLGLWPLQWLIWRIGEPRGRRPSAAALAPDGGDEPADLSVHDSPRGAAGAVPRLGGLVLVLLIGLYVLHTGYGWTGLLRPLGEFTFISRTLTGHADLGVAGNRFRETWLGGVPVPLPAEFVRGLDVQRYEFEKGKWSYLRGEQKFGGWWWYYLYGLGVKTPLGTLLLAAVALVCGRQRRSENGWRDELVLLLPAVTVLGVVSSQTGFNRYLRYVLPAVPLLYVWTGRVTCGIGRRGRWRGACLGVTMLCVVATACSSLRVWPHALTYFNEGAGGSAQGHRHLLDANVDWGQGLFALKDWVEQHPEARPLFVTDFGWIDPRLVGIESTPVPRLLFDAAGRLAQGDVAEVVPGWYVASVNHICGYRHYEISRPDLTWLQMFEPIARPGNALWVYHLRDADIALLRQRVAEATPRSGMSAIKVERPPP